MQRLLLVLILQVETSAVQAAEFNSQKYCELSTAMFENNKQFREMAQNNCIEKEKEAKIKSEKYEKFFSVSEMRSCEIQSTAAFSGGWQTYSGCLVFGLINKFDKNELMISPIKR